MSMHKSVCKSAETKMASLTPPNLKAKTGRRCRQGPESFFLPLHMLKFVDPCLVVSATFVYRNHAHASEKLKNSGRNMWYLSKLDHEVLY
jgi:hypothetical protein